MTHEFWDIPTNVSLAYIPEPWKNNQLVSCLMNHEVCDPTIKHWSWNGQVFLECCVPVRTSICIYVYLCPEQCTCLDTSLRWQSRCTGLRIRHDIDTCLEEIGQCLQILLTTLNSIVNSIRRIYVFTFKKSKLQLIKLTSLSLFPS